MDSRRLDGQAGGGVVGGAEDRHPWVHEAEACDDTTALYMGCD